MTGNNSTPGGGGGDAARKDTCTGITTHLDGHSARPLPLCMPPAIRSPSLRVTVPQTPFLHLLEELGLLARLPNLKGLESQKGWSLEGIP